MSETSKTLLLAFLRPRLEGALCIQLRGLLVNLSHQIIDATSDLKHTFDPEFNHVDIRTA